MRAYALVSFSSNATEEEEQHRATHLKNVWQRAYQSPVGNSDPSLATLNGCLQRGKSERIRAGEFEFGFRCAARSAREADASRQDIFA